MLDIDRNINSIIYNRVDNIEKISGHISLWKLSED